MINRIRRLFKRGAKYETVLMPRVKLKVKPPKGSSVVFVDGCDSIMTVYVDGEPVEFDVKYEKVRLYKNGS
jgi:hypothetical protein